jgi:formate-dependent nitrite reductase membrane component NrfD
MSEQQPTASANGARPDGQAHSYYGQPVIKEPVWTWEIPWYFFIGGLAGASSGLAFGARLAGNDPLARRALFTALGGAAVSPALLTSDLGRPERFINMLRVFKPTSPMNLGTWVLSSFSLATGAAVASDLTGIGRPLGRVFEGMSALTGLPLATYTAVLISDTSVPVWHEARYELPFVFAAGSAASAGAAEIILTPPEQAGPARRLLVGGSVLELGAVEVMKHRLGGLLSEPYREGEAGRYDRLAKACTAAGATVTVLAARRSRAAVAGGTLALAGAALERWSVFKAGLQSARDPKYTVIPQRERKQSKEETDRVG